MSDDVITSEVIRVLKLDIEYTKTTIAKLDVKIAKLEVRRDRHMRYLGRCEERLDGRAAIASATQGSAP